MKKTHKRHGKKRHVKRHTKRRRDPSSLTPRKLALRMYLRANLAARKRLAGKMQEAVYQDRRVEELYAEAKRRGWSEDPLVLAEEKGRQAAGRRRDPKRYYPSRKSLYRHAYHVEHVRLDRGGYDKRGRYYGHGEKLYRVTSDDGSFDEFVRAPNAKAAKDRAFRKRAGSHYYPYGKISHDPRRKKSRGKKRGGWFGNKRGHSLAAKKGHARKGRRGKKRRDPHVRWKVETRSGKVHHFSSLKDATRFQRAHGAYAPRLASSSRGYPGTLLGKR